MLIKILLSDLDNTTMFKMLYFLYSTNGLQNTSSKSLNNAKFTVLSIDLNNKNVKNKVF